jgi:hypothetical protein
MKLTGKNRSTREKNYPSATLFTTNPTWTDPGSNPGLRDERPATNRPSNDTAFLQSQRYKEVYKRLQIRFEVQHKAACTEPYTGLNVVTKRDLNYICNIDLVWGCLYRLASLADVSEECAAFRVEGGREKIF